MVEGSSTELPPAPPTFVLSLSLGLSLSGTHPSSISKAIWLLQRCTSATSSAASPSPQCDVAFEYPPAHPDLAKHLNALVCKCKAGLITNAYWPRHGHKTVAFAEMQRPTFRAYINVPSSVNVQTLH